MPSALGDLGIALRATARSLLNRTGLDIVRLPGDQRTRRPSHDTQRPLPPGAADTLRLDHPRLLQLRERYSRVELPMRPTMWGGDFLTRELNLANFRGDNAYVWQYRHFGDTLRRKYYLYLRDIASRDTRGLLNKLDEDGLFGCWSFDYPGWPQVSRDLLDSINELYFLEQHTQLLSRGGQTVLDIGAGYGRLAHRALAAAPELKGYLCVDAVPESTFLCEYYLRFRNCGNRAVVVPFDELDSGLANRRVDVAVNIHSFSEMSIEAIDGWLSRVAALKASWLLIVPNDADRMLTMEGDGRRLDFAPLLDRHGYELAIQQPVFPDPSMREFLSVSDHFFLFRRTAS